jgi:hypothetical protein
MNEIEHKPAPYKFDSVSFGDLQPGDLFLQDSVFGLSRVVKTKAITDGLEWPGVSLTVETRVLAFDRRAADAFGGPYAETVILRYAAEPVLKASIPVPS